MKALLLSIIALGYCSAAEQDAHPFVHQLTTTADVIVVARLHEPKIWMTSELVVMTGHSNAWVERTIKGGKLPQKVTIQVVRHLDSGNFSTDPPQKPSEAKGFPASPATPTGFIPPDDKVSLENAGKFIVFLQRSKDGTLRAADGFLYTLPYSSDLENLVVSLTMDKSNKPQMDNRR